ncbi:MAG: cytochrome c oxidase subunit II [Candidatus Thermoplasmatota archaeon]|nr:cytochrome c oxidase subunit II [Candidatus Thermoplasmatota archaeon]
MRGALPITLLVSLLAIASPALAVWGMPDGVTDRMETMNDIYGQIMVAGIIVFVFVMGWTVVALIRFRPGGAGRKTDEKHRGSMKAELVWTIIPLLLVSWIGFISYGGLIDLQEPPPTDDPVEIKVTGFQWFWQVEYENGAVMQAKPDENGDIAPEDAFLMPADTPVLFNMTGADVIHALWIPELGVKSDATPGKNTFQWTQAPEGEYFTQCAEYCGTSHAYMRAQFNAVPEDEFQQEIDRIAREQAAAGLSQTFQVNLTDEGFDPVELQAVASVPLRFQITNQVDAQRTITIPGVEDAELTLGPTATDWLNVTLDAGTASLTTEGANATIEVVEAETATVELFEWGITPDLQISADKATIIEVVNAGATLHNYYVGEPREEAGEDNILYESLDLQPGESTKMLILPTEDQVGTWTAWCDIPGHYQQGMVAQLTIG